MENFNKKQKENILYAIKWAFKIAEDNNYDGIKNILERGGMDIYHDKEKRKLFWSFKDDSVALNKLAQIGRLAKEDLISGNYSDNIKNLIREYDMLKDLPGIKLAKEEDIKELVLEGNIKCKRCGAESDFSKDILAGITIDQDVKLYCDNCDSIIAIVKAKNKWTKYEADVLKDDIKQKIYLKAIDIEHAYAKLASKGYSENDIVEIKNITKPTSMENENPAETIFDNFEDENPSDAKIIEAEKDIIAKDSEEDEDFAKPDDITF